MSRPRSSHVAAVKAALAARLQAELVHPGARFLSTRAVAQRFAVSYQTAHRLLAELRDEGLLRRRAASGSYVPGRRPALRGVQLVFHARAKRKGSFGAHLLSLLQAAIEARGVAVCRSWATPVQVPRFRADHYPIMWECPAAVQAAAAARRFALCLNDSPPPGLGGGYVDAIKTDDFSGGACAAELLKARTGGVGGLVALAGPASDPRSQQRIAGFRAHARAAGVIWAASWFIEAGLECAPALLEKRPSGVFACSDRLAEALIDHGRAQGRRLPPLVGFDNAPVAARLGLTSVGIPWTDMVTHAVERVAQRLAGRMDPAKVVTLSHEPVLRLTC